MARAMKASRWMGVLAPLLLAALVGAVLWFNPVRQEPPATRADCAELTRGCALSVEGRAIRLGVDREIRVLQPFGLWLEAPGVARAEVRFTMPDMDMGFNLYVLRPGPDGVLRATVTLPVCVSGSREWLMTLDLDGTRLSVPFVTNL
ncbi:MAG: hypothetical protein FD187_1033 [bacterium]|nr:MAG: hypothetical protein FD142_2225 [bacterium]KAF0149392.1 MAG: hypothetical protein FD187_1033 [bacterium]KAF0168617.1 MAG: hypothetical protein FD158_1054 [bacterium]TXT23189.1 MAG: hypothetical protein FD132_115 [bacterium]